MSAIFDPSVVNNSYPNYDPSKVRVTDPRFNPNLVGINKTGTKNKVKVNEKIDKSKSYILVKGLGVGAVAIIAGTALVGTIAAVRPILNPEYAKPYFAKEGYIDYQKTKTSQLYDSSETVLDELLASNPQIKNDFEKLDSLTYLSKMIGNYNLRVIIPDYTKTNIKYDTITESQLKELIDIYLSYDKDLMLEPDNPKTIEFYNVAKLLLDAKESIDSYSEQYGQQIISDYAKYVFAADICDAAGLDVSKVTDIEMSGRKVFVTCDGIKYRSKITKGMAKDLEEDDIDESLLDVKEFVTSNIENDHDMKVRPKSR